MHGNIDSVYMADYKQFGYSTDQIVGDSYAVAITSPCNIATYYSLVSICDGVANNDSVIILSWGVLTLTFYHY